MIRFLLPTWAVILVSGVLIGLSLLTYTTCSHPQQGAAARQWRVVQAQLNTSLHRVAADTLRAAQALAQGQRYTDSARAATHRATLLHLQTHRHASLRPAADTGAQRLQQFLSAY